MTTGRPAFYKRKLIIDAPLQLTLLFYTVIVVVMTTSINLFSGRISDPTKPLLYDVEIQSWRMIGFGGTVLVFSVLFLMIVFLSNRIAGPIHRLKQHMVDLTEGKITEPIQFRKNDHFSDLAGKYNALIEKRILKDPVLNNEQKVLDS
jgi:methyl-accepting chemotaxis protein